MNISIYQIKKKLEIRGNDLNSRDWGVLIRQEIETEIKEMLKRPDDIVVLDFENINSFNSSIADEVIVLLLRDTILEMEDVYLVSKNIPDNSLYDLELVTAHRKIMVLVQQKGRKRPVIVYGDQQSKKREIKDFVLYDYIMHSGRSSAREIADLVFKKDINTASMYLGKLYKARLVRRREVIDSQGKQYIYTPVI